jgi:cytosine/adenosine deaminase-related metal-dependent hydrolase
MSPALGYPETRSAIDIRSQIPLRHDGADTGALQETDFVLLIRIRVIDGDGRTLVPGLIDAHVHLNMQFGGHGTDRGIQGMQNLTWEEIGALAYEVAHE